MQAILTQYGFSPSATLTQLEGGLINRTYQVDEGARRSVLQRLHPIFKPEVNLDIQAITGHLAARGLHTPRVVPTLDGALWVIDDEGFSWRMLSWLPGRTFSVVEKPEQAYSAAQLVARFHGAVSDLQHTFHFTRPGAHDTPRHMATLEQALRSHADHPRYDEAASVADEILSRARALPPLPSGPLRIIHGDLKISNVLFDGDRAHALLDLDTMAHQTIPIELGDALRSWCNPAGEDASRASLRSDVFEAAIRGYAPNASWLTREEQDAIVLGLETIALELSARFCADIVVDKYWGWNAARYASRADHNLVRAESQLSLAASVAQQRSQLETIVRAHF
ncbi:MAG TPA: phosphotransferase [Polyangiales bacterium]|nr:phosphotransferase [Polyangiales bacterium]